MCYRIAGKFGGRMFGEFTHFSIWQKKVWRMNRSAKGLLIATTTLDGFSLTIAQNSPDILAAKLSHYIVAMCILSLR